MYYAYKYRLEPSDAHREELDRHRDSRSRSVFARYASRARLPVA